MASKAHLNQAIASHYVELKADEEPDRQIFIFEKGELGEDILTYRDLHENANKIARMFVDNGIGKGDTFVVYMRNHPEFVCAMLAGGVIGAIMVPTDPRYRGERLKFFLNNCKAKAVLTSAECLTDLEEVLPLAPTVRFVAVAWRPEQGAPGDRHISLTEVMAQKSWKTVDQEIMDVRHPMQIIYTSGTTGDPKGVMIRNNRTGLFNILTKLVWQYRKEDVLYNGLSLTHGNAQAVTLFPAIYMGIKAVFSPRFTKSRIWDICRKYRCTTYSLLGGMMAGIFNEPERPDDGDNPVRIVISAGTPAPIWESFEKRFNVNILEWYGAVEGGFAYKPVGKGPIGSFGKPIPGVMEFRVVDENDNPVPPNVPGELISRMIKGDTRVDYLGLPEASKEKTQGGWLRSGDIVHRDEQGWYFFHFRKGTELRRMGDFIQPEYVETVVGRHPDVTEVAVYGVPAASGAPGESDLVAAVAPFAGKRIVPADLFAYFRRSLETNFIPSWLQVVEEIPKTITEKALVRKLREAFDAREGELYKLENYP
jgi:acyl-CoA synthetase (AMP-forming)/AMP-acid ligase II